MENPSGERFRGSVAPSSPPDAGSESGRSDSDGFIAVSDPQDFVMLELPQQAQTGTAPAPPAPPAPPAAANAGPAVASPPRDSSRTSATPPGEIAAITPHPPLNPTATTTGQATTKEEYHLGRLPRSPTTSAKQSADIAPVAQASLPPAAAVRAVAGAPPLSSCPGNPFETPREAAAIAHHHSAVACAPTLPSRPGNPLATPREAAAIAHHHSAVACAPPLPCRPGNPFATPREIAAIAHQQQQLQSATTTTETAGLNSDDTSADVGTTGLTSATTATADTGAPIARDPAALSPVSTSTVASRCAAAAPTTTAAPPLPSRPFFPHPGQDHRCRQESQPPLTWPSAAPPGVPPLPPHYVQRAALLDQVVRVLTDNSYCSLYALLGDSGSGKTVLASAIVSHPKIQTRFRGGIFWASLGRAGEKAPNASAASVSTAGATSEDAQSNTTSGGLGQRDGRMRALLRALAAQDVAVLQSRPASAGEAVRQLARTHVDTAALGNRGQPLLVLDGLSDGVAVSPQTLAELHRAGFVLLVTCKKQEALSLLRDEWATAACTALPVQPGSSERAETETPPRSPGAAVPGVAFPGSAPTDFRGWLSRPSWTRRPVKASKRARLQEQRKEWQQEHEYQVSILRGVTEDEAVDVLLKRAARWRRDGAATGWAAEEVSIGNGEGGGINPGRSTVPGTPVTPCALQIVEHCGEASPLALAIIGAVLASSHEGNRSPPCDTPPPFNVSGRCRRIEQQLFGKLGGGGGDGGGVLRGVVELGFDALRGDAARECFVRLGVLAEGATARFDMLSNLWEHELAEDTERVIDELSDKSFLHETQPGSCHYRVHDPILAFAKTKLSGEEAGATEKARVPDDGDAAEEQEEEGAEGGGKATTAAPAGMVPSTAAATRITREVAVALQTRYLSRLDVLARFCGGGGGGDSRDDDDEEMQATRRCGDAAMLGGIPALAALWQSLEKLRSGDGTHRDDGAAVAGGGVEEASTAPETVAAAGSRPQPLLKYAYTDALKEMGTCVEAVFGCWAAAKVLRLERLTVHAGIMARKSWCMGETLYSARAAEAERLFSDIVLLKVQGKGDEVIECYRELSESAKIAHGPRHPAVASALCALARVLLEQGKLDSAEARYREALTVLEDSVGDDHPLVASILIDLVETSMTQATTVLRGYSEHPPPWRRRTARRHQTIVRELSSRAHSICHNDIGVMDEREKAACFSRLAQALEEQGDLEEAERLLRIALCVLQEKGGRRVGPVHVQVGATMVTLADLLGKQTGSEQNERQEATELLYHAVDIGRKWFHQDPAHEKLALWRNKLAASLAKQGKHVEAAAQFLEVAAHFKERPSADHQAILDASHAGLYTLAQLADFDELMARTMAFSDEVRPAGLDEASTVAAAAAAAAADPTKGSAAVTTPTAPPLPASVKTAMISSGGGGGGGKVTGIPTKHDDNGARGGGDEALGRPSSNRRDGRAAGERDGIRVEGKAAEEGGGEDVDEGGEDEDQYEYEYEYEYEHEYEYEYEDEHESDVGESGPDEAGVAGPPEAMRCDSEGGVGGGGGGGGEHSEGGGSQQEQKKSLEAAALYLFAHKPQSVDRQETQAWCDDQDLDLQNALALSLGGK